MAGCKVVTRKLVTFHDRDEEFSNVYYFGDGSAGLSPTESTALDLLDAVIAEEKSITGTVVRFLGGAVYKVGVADTPGDTDAIAIRELAATGNQGAFTTPGTVYRECAQDIKWLLGGRRYLRTLIHTCASHGMVVDGSTGASNLQISSELKAYAQRMLNGAWPGGYERIAPNGDRPTAYQINPVLEHRQFHRYKKRRNGALLA